MEISVYEKMPSPKSGSESKYPDEIRKQASEDYLFTDMSYKEVQIRYNLPTKNIVASFVRWYKNTYNLSVINSNREMEPSSKTKNLKEAEMLKLLEHAKLKIESLETMIDIAQTEFNIDIRKKSGSKPSKK